MKIAQAAIKDVADFRYKKCRQAGADDMKGVRGICRKAARAAQSSYTEGSFVPLFGA